MCQAGDFKKFAIGLAAPETWFGHCCPSVYVANFPKAFQQRGKLACLMAMETNRSLAACAETTENADSFDILSGSESVGAMMFGFGCAVGV